MKKLLILSGVLGLMSFTSPTVNFRVNTPLQTEFAACKYGQCHATAKSTGNRCCNCAQKVCNVGLTVNL